ncbi:MAG: GNAT family N-acetyltransferase [Catenulispora sp.]|nr:GNAT family N-acetyltransferase [Catenulispora sp.]
MTVSIRPADQPGDIGIITTLHGRHYAAACGMDQTVEAYIAAGLAAFVEARFRDGAAAGECWVAESAADGIVGSIGITRADARTLQLRWFILDASQRGQGLGRRLLDTALDYCRAQDADRVFLLTVAGLNPAHHLYRKAGFELTGATPGRQWGVELVEQRFDLILG